MTTIFKSNYLRFKLKQLYYRKSIMKIFDKDATMYFQFTDRKRRLSKCAKNSKNHLQSRCSLNHFHQVKTCVKI